MICLLDVFLFTLTQSESMGKKVDLPYATHDRLGNYPAHFAVGKYKDSYDFNATFYYNERFTAYFLEEAVKQKKPLWLVFPDGTAEEVIVRSFEVNRHRFTLIGAAVITEVKLQMDVYYE